MLELKTKTTINPAGTELYIEFNEATGLYDAVDNPGGFGAPNPAKNTLAFFLYAVHKKVAGDVLATILANNPTTVNSFTLSLTKDVNGVLYFVVIGLEFFDSLLTYEDGDIVYDDTTNPVNPVIKEMVEGEWVVRTLAELVGNDEIHQVEDYAFPIPNAIAFSNQLNADKLLSYKNWKNKVCDEHDYGELKDRFLYIDGTIKAATTAFCGSAYNQAQIKIEEVFKFEASL